MDRFRMQERDLDLFILEELHADTGFANWLARRVGLDGFECLTAHHSVSARAGARWGETDVLAFFGKETQRVALLIEDKIAASFTDRQAERYHERAAEIVRDGDADRYLTLLVAPRSYLAGVPADDPWHHRLPIEALRDWFGAQGGAHARWRATCLTECLDRVHRSVTPGQEDVVRFGEGLAAYLARHHGPTLSHRPGRDPSGPIIRYPGAAKNELLWWKIGQNRMTLQIAEPIAAQLLGMRPPEGISHAAHSKLHELYIDVPAVDATVAPEDQRDVIEAAMAAAYRLIAFRFEIEGTNGHE